MYLAVSLFKRLFSSPQDPTKADNNQTGSKKNKTNCDVKSNDEDENNNSVIVDSDSQHGQIEWSKRRVLEPKMMLSDNEIFAALKLLKRQFESNTRRGFYDPQSFNVRRTKKFDFRVHFPLERFVQILHIGEQLHWITLSNFRSRHENQVQAYDSLPIDSTYTGATSSSSSVTTKKNAALQNCLRRILKGQTSNVYQHQQSETDDDVSVSNPISIECCIEPVQRQPDATMCGLFAIAFALDLCLDIDPASQTYDVTRMRAHLFECLSQGCMREFPKSHITRTFNSPNIVFIDI